MAGRMLTNNQQRHVGRVLTGLVAALDAHGASWPKKLTDDVQEAYRIVGVPCPFTVRPATEEAPKPGLVQRVKGALGIGA
jgi:hypothetical protein